MTLNIHGIKSTFPTPAYSHVGRGEFTDVYDPAEDTFLLIDALEMEADSLKARCTDINPSAAACALETAQINRLRIDPVITDLANGLLPRLQGQIDLLLFNPPYVVTPPEEVGCIGIQAAWAGGKNGREVMDRFFPLVPKLLSQKGYFYLLVLKENNPDEIAEKMKSYGLEGCKLLSRQAGIEYLTILKFWKTG
ncbi:methyltransferase N6AMT1 isoform X2 [Pseudophryne corroboree]|uniref:methyltransferase N6AMT1 isoform X2 n=1 Tax=Pseudophryne corroboree TaxID=495146 RepID=UPI003081E423